jgi:glycosyltransferase involved in cell wall biosynthesis
LARGVRPFGLGPLERTLLSGMAGAWWSGHRKLRIAQLAPLWVRLPPVRYGGTERVVHALTEALVQRGHDVTLFAAGGSVTSARLCAGSPAPFWEAKGSDTLSAQLLQVEEVVRHSAEFDIIHSHLDGFPWLAGERFKAPLITTLHGRLDLPEQHALLAAYCKQPLISISDSQRRPVHDLHLNWVATIHHGLDLAQTYTLGQGDGGYLAFVGRVSPEKDPVTAIRVAIRAGIPLKIAARVDPVDEEYHRQKVVPYLGHPLIEWLGEIDDLAKAELLAGAQALLMPNDWEEPFGLSYIEALASGTPVIARPRGSLPEIIVHGVHGFLVETEDELVTAVKRAPSIDRSACRDWALKRFSVERMVDDYERAYLAVLEMGQVPRASPTVMAVESA